jgi:isopentenyl-diphosphate delta-isomerase
MQENVILVDKNDKEIGFEEKIKAHCKAKLHRAFSIFIFNSSGDLLLQKRAKSKYHSGGLWTNTCCGHPRPGETLENAARRRLKEEMKIFVPLKKIFSFIYKVKLDKNLFEHEYDWVFIGKFNGKPRPNPKEAENWKWENLDKIKNDLQKNSQNYTFWFKICFAKVKQYLESL